MAKYLITFPSGAMDHVPAQELADVGLAARACCQEMIDAGVLVMAGGLADEPGRLVATDGTVTECGRPDAVSGITVVDVPSREEALAWAATIAAACRCAQEVRAVSVDPELDAMLRAAEGGSSVAG